MGKIKGWEKSRFKSEPDTWYSNNKSRIAVRETADGFYHIFYNENVLSAPSRNMSIGYSTKYENARKDAIKFMRRHPNG